jgi:hypothetical protein
LHRPSRIFRRAFYSIFEADIPPPPPPKKYGSQFSCVFWRWKWGIVLNPGICKKICSLHRPRARISFEFEYLAKFEVKFVTNLGYESGDLVGSFDEINKRYKIQRSVP